KGDPDEPRGKAVEDDRRDGKVALELGEAGGEFREVRDPGSDRGKAEEHEQAEHERVSRQHRGVAPDGVAAARAENPGYRVRIEKEREGRAQRQSGKGGVLSGRVGSGGLQEKL